MFIIHRDDPDPSMRYESLARAAFDCEKWGGPNKIASQEFFRKFVPDLTPEAIEAMKKIIDALMLKVGAAARDELKAVRDSLIEGMPQRTGIELIDCVIKICGDED